MKIAIFSKHEKSTGTVNIRCLQLIEYLKLLGIESSFSLIYQTIPLRGCDYFILHRVNFDRYTQRFISCARELNVPLIYDTDDLLFEQIYDRKKGGNTNCLSQSFLKSMQACDAVTVSTKFLQQQASKYHPRVYLIRNALSSNFLEKSALIFNKRQYRNTKYTVIAYLSGSNSHNEDFLEIIDSLKGVLEKNKSCKLLVVGPLSYDGSHFDCFKDRFEHRDKIPYKYYHSIFEEIDVNLVPLVLNDFSHSKSEIKYIEAAASGVPSIASPSLAYKDVIDNGVNGFLCESKEEWFRTIDLLVNNLDLRQRIGVTARNQVINEYSPEARSKDLARLFNNLDNSLEGSIKKTSWRLRSLQASLGITIFIRSTKSWVNKVLNDFQLK